MKIRDILPVTCVIMIACGDHVRGLHSGDLVFQRPGGSDFEKAISEATRGHGGGFTHVGILEIADGDTLVIESAPDKGVTATPLAEFASECQSLVFVEVEDQSATGAPARARKYIGLPYDWQFLPDNGAVYCSELVQLSYVRDDGTPLFAPVPISFLDESGQIPQFWLRLYAEQGIQVPHGMSGSSPNSIFSQCYYYKKTEKYK